MKKPRLFLLLALLSACALALLTPGVGAWQVALKDPDGTSARAEAVVIDAAGDVISAGLFPSFSVLKTSGATGEVKWRFSSSLSAAPLDIAADANGDVFIVSTIRFVLKLSGVDGTQIWSKPVGGTSNAFPNYLYSVKVDGNGDVVTAGYAGGLFHVSKLNGLTGEQVWHYEREGYALKVAVDAFGNVAAAGKSNQNFAVVKLRGTDGMELWERELNGGGSSTDISEEARAVVMDADGSVIAAGNTSNIFANSRDFTVVKYGPDGCLLWSHAIDGGWCVINGRGERICQSNDEANAIALDRDGNIFVGGSKQTDADSNIEGANEHFFVAKFSRDGSFIWGEAAEDFPWQREFTRGRAISLSVDSAGDAVAAGQHGLRSTVVKYAGGGSQHGKRQWLKQLGRHPSPGNSCTAVEVVFDADDNVVVAGETLAQDQFSLFTVIKLWGSDGLSYFAEPTFGQIKLHLLTFNILGGTCGQPRADEDFARLINRLQTLKEVYALDVLALQEIHLTQADAIAKSLGFDFTVYYPTSCDNGRGNAILSRYPIETWGALTFDSQSDEEDEKRNVIGAGIRVYDRLVYVYNTHLTSRGPSSNEPNEIRAKQAVECVAFTDELPSEEGGVVLMGDFNAERNLYIPFSSNPYAIATNKFEDAWALWASRHNIDIDDPEGYTTGTGGLYPQPFKRVDYIFIPQGSRLNVEVAGVINTLDLSDHYPVFARLSLY